MSSPPGLFSSKVPFFLKLLKWTLQLRFQGKGSLVIFQTLASIQYLKWPRAGCIYVKRRRIMQVFLNGAKLSRLHHTFSIFFWKFMRKLNLYYDLVNHPGF